MNHKQQLSNHKSEQVTNHKSERSSITSETQEAVSQQVKHKATLKEATTSLNHKQVKMWNSQFNTREVRLRLH